MVSQVEWAGKTLKGTPQTRGIAAVRVKESSERVADAERRRCRAFDDDAAPIHCEMRRRALRRGSSRRGATRRPRSWRAYSAQKDGGTRKNTSTF